jgi:hypothetical protein
MRMTARICCALLAAGFATAAAAGETWAVITDDVGSNPVTTTVRQQYDLGAAPSIDVRGIGGGVSVTAGTGNRVEFVYERRGATQRDLDCATLRHERDDDSLKIAVVSKRERECQVVHATDQLTLIVPRGASVEVRNIGDAVSIAGVEGMLRLSSIGDSVTITGGRQVEASSIGDSIKLDIPQLGPRGIRLSSIGDSVDLTLPEKLEARLRIRSVGDEIRGPGLHRTSEDDDFETELGKGGPDIRIDSVGDTVVIRGPRLDGGKEL